MALHYAQAYIFWRLSIFQLKGCTHRVNPHEKVVMKALDKTIQDIYLYKTLVQISMVCYEPKVEMSLQLNIQQDTSMVASPSKR